MLLRIFSKSKLRLKWHIRHVKLRNPQKIACPSYKTAYPPNFFQFFFWKSFQIPICLVNKGAIPHTRKEKPTMVQSCHVTLLNDADFNKETMHRNAYPLLLCYNGRDHFTPTKPTTDAEFYNWKLNRELGPIVSASLMVIEELDRHMLQPNILTAINQFEATIVQTLPIISPTANASHLRAVSVRNKQGATHRGAVIEPFGPPVPGTSTPQPPHPPSTATQEPIPPADVPEGDEPGDQPEQPVQKKKENKYVCHICGLVRTRKPDLTGHLQKVHGEGEPIVCNRPPCKGTYRFSTKAALKKHVDGQHKKKWPYRCKDCYYGTHSKAYFVEHRITKHGARMVNKETREPL